MKRRNVFATFMVTFATLAAVDKLGPGDLVEDVTAIPSSLCGVAHDSLAAIGLCSPREREDTAVVAPAPLTSINVELALEGNKLGTIHLAVDQNGQVVDESVEVAGAAEMYFSEL